MWENVAGKFVPGTNPSVVASSICFHVSNAARGCSP